MSWMIWIVAVWLVFNGIVTVTIVGQPRELMTPSGAAFGMVASFGLAALAVVGGLQ